MTLNWRTLESWTTYQDYIWFLALLAWSGVIAAEFRRWRATDPVSAKSWLAPFAACSIAGILVELFLIAQNLRVPYLKLDLAMGLAQAAGTGVLVWAATARSTRKHLWRLIAWTLLAALAGCRWWWPVPAGWSLALLQAAAMLALVRADARSIPAPLAVLLTLAPLVATHGPWAYAIDHGRRATDWSHFALLAASCQLIAGTWLAAQAWRRQLQGLDQDPKVLERIRRDLRVAVLALTTWLVCGLALSAWYGQQTRRLYEGSLIHRMEVAVLALDPQLVVAALGPELRITRIQVMHYPDGTPVDVATVPHTVDPIYTTLRDRLGQIRKRNADLERFYILVLRDEEMLVLSSEPRTGVAVTHIIRHHATQPDRDRLAAGTSFIEGPMREEKRPSWGTLVAAHAPLTDPKTGQTIGWLVGEVYGTAWAATLTLARLQAMGLVGVGVGFWTLAVAYRLRRGARELAERKAAESAAADMMKSAFLAKVSHELRTPIQSVLGYGELLANGSLGEPHASWIASLRSHGTVMLRLVNDLIDMGALQSGAFRLELAPANLRAIIADGVAAVGPAAAAKQLAIETQIDADIPAWARSDGVRLRQILLNLLMNAVKFTPAGRVSLTVRRRDGEVQFVVEDSGPGIPPDLREQLFKPFARLDPAAAAGSGLGLALVHGLAQALGGEVWLDTTAEVGARFIVQLPLAPCPAPRPDAVDDPLVGVSLAGLTVLVAEDNTLVAELLVAFLKQHAATALVAGDGPGAEAIAREQRPNVLLLDIGLPGRDGIAVAEALRRDGPPELRIIGLSAHAGQEEETRARAAGMNDFLTKPVNLARLARILAAQPAPAAAASSIRVADPGLRATLAAQFAQETPQVLEQMEAAIAANDWPQLRARAHYLKNSADVIGAAALQEACRNVMRLAPAPDPGVVRQLLEAVIAAVPTSPFPPSSESPGRE